ncbi:DUF1003 domain-containing protein [Sporomusa termitida]|uniref:DUF1003 domain-containing protein n=1 Tax=Sporomusa termitida TaxID=2377 RepID=A0A517DQ27_9FIRM|nr:DUF1003 domain-containing protein [Sporomusa termitida]QDR79460.1 hypothetical protein SPTER_07350 [Sporomusa termitida]
MNNQDRPNLGPAAKYRMKQDLVKNAYREFQEQQTYGQRVADYVARVVGSWPFIIGQSVIILIWMGANAYLVYMKVMDPGYFDAWDPYPFILLNLVLSFQAAYTGPVVMMSQNRQSEKDRLMAELDYQLNKKSAEEIEVIMAHLVYQDEVMNKLMSRLEERATTADKDK